MTTETDPQKGNLGAVVFAAFAAVLIIAFLANRGGDIGQLAGLVRNLGGGPLFGNDVLSALIDGFSMPGMVIAWFGVGALLISVINKLRGQPVWGYSSRIETVHVFAIGAAVFSITWFFLGTAGFYSRTNALIALVVGFISIFVAAKLGRPEIENEDGKKEIISIFDTKSDREIGDEPQKSSILDKMLISLIALPVALSFIAALAPPVAKDTLLYHVALPKAFVTQGSNAFIDGNIASYLALGTEMHVVWARLLWGEDSAGAASGVITWIFFPLLLMATFHWAREIAISRTWSLIATATVATIPSAYHVASSGYIDLSLALYVTLATYALTRWWKEQTKVWLVLLAIYLGAALSIKLTAVFVFAAFALVILFRARAAAGDAVKIVVGGFAALLLAGAIASPWYLRTWKATGSPVFPFYLSIWKGEATGWDAERSNLFQAMNMQYGGADKGAWSYLTAPVRLSVAAQPEQPVRFDGVLGVAFLIGLPLLVWALWKFDLAVEVKIASGVAGIMFLFWLFSSQQLRYLLPILPLLAIGIAAVAEQLTGRLKIVLQFSLVAASLCALLTTAAWFLQKAPLRVVLGGETRDQYLTRNLDYYPYYHTLNTDTPPDAKVWLINMRRDTYNLERPVFSDYLFEDWTLRKLVWESRTVEDLRAKAAAMDVSYVLARHDFLLDPARSTLFDDKKSLSENDAKLKIAKDFILDPARTIRSDNKFSLIKVF